MAELNPEQRAAVEHGDGPLLILAGAGSGKTRVITHRIASLIERGVDPAAIVAVSFTNKAAGEMSERMAPLIGRRGAASLRTSTFHRFGLEMLRAESKAAGMDGRFVIFDQSDSLGVIKEVLRELIKMGLTRRLDPMAILARISNWKCAMIDPSQVKKSEFEYDAIARDVYPEYEERLVAMRALDFDDLVCRPVRLLRDDAGLRERWQRQIDHLLVDEFQDTSAVQLQLVKLLANDRRNVCVVGDDDQSIYSWRGADVGNILEFERHFPGSVVVRLETNYRSRAPILEVANAVIAGSDGRRHPKRLDAARTGGDAVRRTACDSPRAEAQFVTAEIRQLREEGRRLDDIAVLYRSNQQSRLIEEELTAAGIPNRVFGGQQFFDRKEVKDVAAYLRCVINPWDEISLRRILNYPARGIGARSVQRIEEWGRQQGLSFVKATHRAPIIDGVPDGARNALGRLNAMLEEYRGRLEKTGQLHAVAGELVERIELRRALEDSADGGEQGAHRYQNVLALLRWIERYERGARKDRKSLQDFLQRVTLAGDAREEKKDEAAVTLCTLHAAKGLEFGVVFLIGCVEGQLPHTRTTDPKASEAVAGDLDEERRLFYVGITRAMDRLYLCAPRRRLLRGKAVEVTPSRYMDDLPEAWVEEYERADNEELDRGEVASLLKSLREKHKSDATPV